MCGICGSVSFAGGNDGAELVRRMADTMRHRGPDESGVFVDGEAGLGHARLSILDIAGGRQPMGSGGCRAGNMKILGQAGVSAGGHPSLSRIFERGTPKPVPDFQDKSLWITYNGEIFNYIELREELIKKGHRFATRSDTEVILQLYEEEGERCVERLNGQWAFGIWDARRRRLFLSRDRLGVRPLFYTQTGGRFLFASEIKALLACPEVECELDLQALDQVFTFWATLAPRTAFRNIWQLPPGHSAVLENGRLRVWPYWRLEFEPDAELAWGREDRLREELLALLLDATRIRLRSDVPVGAYLSGGLDSTFTTALTRRLAGDRLRTFSVSFEDAEFDESAYQREASAFLGTEHSDVHCTRNDIARVFPEVIWHAEQPVIRTAPAPLFLLSRLVRDSGFKVVVTGEGADETMGGYDIFKEAKIRSFWSRNPESALRPQLLKRLYPYMDGIQQQPAAYLRKFFQVNGGAPGPFFSHLPRWQLTARLKTFFSEEVRAAVGGYDGTAELRGALPERYHSWDAFLQAQFLETTHLLPGYILSAQGDRMAMAHSVEGRFPFLDYRVVEFAARLPVRLKMKVLDEKHLLKRCAEGLIPPAIRKRPKQPYRAPDGQCFLEPAAREYIDELLSPECLRRYGVFDPAPVTRLLAKFRSGQAAGVKDNMALVGIVSTQLIMQQFVDGRSRRTLAYAGSRTT